MAKRKRSPRRPNVTDKNQLSKNSFNLNNLPKRETATVVIVVVVLFLLYFTKGLFIAATVNGEPIGRLEVVSQLEKTYGQQTLDNLVSKALILQEAKRRNIKVSDQDIDKELQKIDKSLVSQGQTLDQALQAQGMTRAELKERLKVELIARALVQGKVKVTEEDIDKFIEQNKDTLPQNMSQEEIRGSAKSQLEQQGLNTEISKLIADLRKKAKINYFVKY